MALLEQLNNDLKEAMRSGDTLRRDTIRLLVSALKNAEIDAPAGLDSDAETRIVAKELKQRRDSIEEYGKAGRADLVQREQAEVDILAAYQPEQMGADEVRALVAISIGRTGAKGPSDMGRVMKDVMPDIKGRADGSVISAVVRELLASAAG